MAEGHSATRHRIQRCPADLLDRNRVFAAPSARRTPGLLFV